MRDVAVVGFAQRQMLEFDGSPTCVELLVPLFEECYAQTGWTRRDELARRLSGNGGGAGGGASRPSACGRPVGR